MDKIICLYGILVFTEVYLCFVSSKTFNSRQRITNTEIRLDTVTHDIAVFRLDILKIWEHLDQLSIPCSKNCNSSNLPMVEGNSDELRAESDQEKRLYSAFKFEKKAVRNILHKLDNNLTNFQEEISAEVRALQNKHVKVKNKLSNKVSQIEKLSEDLKTLDEYTVSALVKQEARIESLEKDMNRYKTNFEASKEELKLTKVTLKKMEEFNGRVLNNLYKDCPSKWHTFSGSCYYFSKSRAAWGDAETNCRKDGAHLVEYNRIDEAEFVQGLVLSVGTAWGKSKYEGFWVGGSDSDKEGEWLWSSSGKKVNTGFVNWYGRQPDNNGGEENCMTSCVNLEGQWNDAKCGYYLKYVCEKTLLE